MARICIPLKFSPRWNFLQKNNEITILRPNMPTYSPRCLGVLLASVPGYDCDCVDIERAWEAPSCPSEGNKLSAGCFLVRVHNLSQALTVPSDGRVCQHGSNNRLVGLDDYFQMPVRKSRTLINRLVVNSLCVDSNVRPWLCQLPSSVSRLHLSSPLRCIGSYR